MSVKRGMAERSDEIKQVFCELKATDQEKGEFEGWASTYGNVDLQGEVVDQGAFAQSLGKRRRWPLLWSHDPTQPLGSVELQDTPQGLKVRGRLTLAVAKAAEVYALLRDEAINGLSIGFRTVRDRVLSGVRHLVELELFEISLVVLPANPEATVERVKHDVAAEVLRLMSLATAGSILTTLTRGKRLERMLDTSPPTEAERQAMADAVARVQRTLDRRYLPASSHRPTTAYFAKAALLTELGRLRGWSERELRGVLAQL